MHAINGLRTEAPVRKSRLVLGGIDHILNPILHQSRIPWVFVAVTQIVASTGCSD